jgi:hypothetical protein
MVKIEFRTKRTMLLYESQPIMESPEWEGGGSKRHFSAGHFLANGKSEMWYWKKSTEQVIIHVLTLLS